MGGLPETRACGVPLCSWTSSWCGSGRVMACSCNLSNRMDSRCESHMIRVVQQRLYHAHFLGKTGRIESFLDPFARQEGHRQCGPRPGRAFLKIPLEPLTSGASRRAGHWGDARVTGSLQRGQNASSCSGVGASGKPGAVQAASIDSRRWTPATRRRVASASRAGSTPPRSHAGRRPLEPLTLPPPAANPPRAGPRSPQPPHAAPHRPCQRA